MKPQGQKPHLAGPFFTLGPQFRSRFYGNVRSQVTGPLTDALVGQSSWVMFVSSEYHVGESCFLSPAGLVLFCELRGMQ